MGFGSLPWKKKPPSSTGLKGPIGAPPPGNTGLHGPATAAPSSTSSVIEPRRQAASLVAHHHQHRQALSSVLGPIAEIVGIDLAPEDAITISKIGSEEGVDPSLLTSIYSIESGFGTNEGPSSAGAIGKMQFMPETWESYGGGGDPSNTEDAVRAAARYLKASGYKPGDKAAEEAAVYSYNHSSEYVNEVLDRADEFKPLWDKVHGVAKDSDPRHNGLEYTGSPQSVKSAGDVIPLPKLRKWLDANGHDIYHLNPVLARHAIQAAAESGEPIPITSGARDVQDQSEIDPGTNPAAPPGLSAHQFGMAFDSEPSEEQVTDLEKHGIEHGSAGGTADPPHTELTDPALIKKATAFGPIRSGYLPEGVPEATGDWKDWSYDGTVGGGATYTPGSSMASSTSLSPYGAPDNPILNAALNQTTADTTDKTGLTGILGFLDSPVPQIGKPLEPLATDDELLKLATRRRV